MALVLNPAARNVMANAIATAMSGGTLLIQAGAGNTLATVVLPTPAFGAAVDGVVTLRATNEVLATKAGRADRFRVQSADGLTMVEGTITGTGGGGDAILPTTDLLVGVALRVTGMTFRMLETA